MKIMSETPKALDTWERKLEEQIKLLQQCQNQKSLQGCEACELFFECDTRKSYVVAVYESMNKGSGGGFEF
jgi:hypothetical protein